MEKFIIDYRFVATFNDKMRKLKMDKKSLITISIISIFLLAGHAVAALADTKPSTVQSEIIQLDAVKKSLNKIHDRLLKILENPPDDTMPTPNMNVAVGRLGAMYHHLLILSGFIDSSIEILGNPPSDPEAVAALEGVGGKAQGISDNIGEYLKNATTPREFIDALKVVKGTADNIVKSTTNQTVLCGDYTTPVGCRDDDNCKWYPAGECRDRIE